MNLNISILLALLTLIPSFVLTCLLIFKYLRFKNEKIKHLLSAFVCFTLSFLTVSTIITWCTRSGIQPIHNYLIRIFDILLILGIYFFFLFFTDFIISLKRHIKYVNIHLLSTLCVILFSHYQIVMEGHFHVILRLGASSVFFLIFGALYQTIATFQFFKLSFLMEDIVIKIQTRILGVAAGISIFAICMIPMAVFFEEKKFLISILAISTCMISIFLYYLGTELSRLLKSSST